MVRTSIRLSTLGIVCIDQAAGTVDFIPRATPPMSRAAAATDHQPAKFPLSMISIWQQGVLILWG